MIDRVLKAASRPDKTMKWAIVRIDGALRAASWQRSLRQSQEEFPRYPLHEMSDFEAAIFENGKRCVPGLSHDRAQSIWHHNRYVFFRKVIARDRRSLFPFPFASPPHISILDLGCGVGHGCATLATLPNCSVLGIDSSPEAIEYASLHYHRPNVEYRVADILEFVEDMPEYDYIVSSHVLEHIHDGISVLRKLRFKKKLLVATPYDESPGSIHHVLFHIKEDVYADFPRKRIYYDDFWGTIHRHRRAGRLGLICVISK